MTFEQNQEFRAALSRGTTSAEATRSRYREVVLDSVEAAHRARVIATDDEPGDGEDPDERG